MTSVKWKIATSFLEAILGKFGLEEDIQQTPPVEIIRTLTKSYPSRANVNARNFLTKDEWAFARETVQINAHTVQFVQNRLKSHIFC